MNIGGKQNIWHKFLDFETKNNLFEFKDDEGTFYWDVLRYEVYIRLLWGSGNVSVAKNNNRNIRLSLKKIVGLVKLFYFDFSKKEQLFYVTSRNKKEEGEQIDQNSIDEIELFDKEKTMLIESYPEVLSRKSYGIKNNYLLPQIFYRKIAKKKKFDFSSLYSLLQDEFGELGFGIDLLERTLHNYYSDLVFFKRVFKRKGIQKIFITQNGIQKGLFRAAKDLNIEVYEFQHGVVNEGHLAYNYPLRQYEPKQVSLPNKILSLAPFWFQELNLPNVEICSVGNDYFYNPIKKAQEIVEDKGTITIISAGTFGQKLLDFILEDDFVFKTKEMKIFFKLHPNQYVEKDFYSKKLKSMKNVQVITNEQTVGQLLEKSGTLFTILSTTIYEALQSQRKVILLKESPYEHQSHVFNHPNLHLVDTVGEFTEGLKKEIDTAYKTQYFEPFDKEAFLKAL